MFNLWKSFTMWAATVGASLLIGLIAMQDQIKDLLEGYGAAPDQASLWIKTFAFFVGVMKLVGVGYGKLSGEKKPRLEDR